MQVVLDSTRRPAAVLSALEKEVSAESIPGQRSGE